MVMRGGAPSASLRRELASIDMTKRNTVVLDSNTLPSASGGLLTKSSSIKIHKRSDMRDVSRDSKNSKMPRSQHVKWPKEHTQESLTFQQAGRFPKILVGGKRDFSGENTGPPSRRFSSRPMRVGKASKRPAGAGIAKTETLNFFQDKMSLTDDGSFPTERTLGQNEADEIAPTAKSRTCLERQTGSGRSMASHGPLSPYDCASRGTDKTKAEMFLATLQQRNQELLLENGYLKEALLASVTNGKLLFLLENNDTADATDERESRTLAVSSWVPGTDKALSSEGSPREGHLQTRRTKSIDLPCVREFFEAVSCCIGPSCRDPPLLPRDGLVALADGFGMDTFHEPPQTIEKLHRSTEDENDGTSIKVDFFPFGHPEDDEAAQTDVNQISAAVSSSACSPITDEKITGHFPTKRSFGSPAVMGSARLPSRLTVGTLQSLPPNLDCRAAKDALFFPSTIPLTALLPQSPYANPCLLPLTAINGDPLWLPARLKESLRAILSEAPSPGEALTGLWGVWSEYLKHLQALKKTVDQAYAQQKPAMRKNVKDVGVLAVDPPLMKDEQFAQIVPSVPSPWPKSAIATLVPRQSQAEKDFKNSYTQSFSSENPVGPVPRRKTHIGVSAASRKSLTPRKRATSIPADNRKMPSHLTREPSAEAGKSLRTKETAPKTPRLSQNKLGDELPRANKLSKFKNDDGPMYGALEKELTRSSIGPNSPDGRRPTVTLGQAGTRRSQRKPTEIPRTTLKTAVVENPEAPGKTPQSARAVAVRPLAHGTLGKSAEEARNGSRRASRATNTKGVAQNKHSVANA